jgi:hypothetical protein
MFDINKTLMRCLTKNLAMFGLGLYIYAGEDLPEGETTPATTVQAPTRAEAQAQPKQSTPELEELKKGTENWEKVVAYVTANKSLGIDAIGKQLNRKYKMTPAIKKEIANLQKQLKALTSKANKENNKRVVEHDYKYLLDSQYVKHVDNSSNPGYVLVMYTNTFNVKKTTYKDKVVLTWDERVVYVTRYENGTGCITFNQNDHRREYHNNESYSIWTTDNVEKISKEEFDKVWDMCSATLTASL